ncbi:hypothetical protein Slin15195_G108290 [Septoria linicola]|uniref:DUF7888 domain-containing protein n=1 Tax=Septoria linicola TaxID=215465 RepID=A0A9Q9ENX4_9PEZI|nr:hypothetical protein Slin15195_G108290 [Septoria linicola]
MKFTAIALSAMVGAAFAAPTEHKFVQPGGNHDYKVVSGGSGSGSELTKRIKRDLAIAMGTVGVSLVGGFFAGPVANRILNDVFGVQKKRSIHVNVDDLTFDEAREIYIEHFVDTTFKENPFGGETDAAVCAGVGYYISDPSATLDAVALKFSADGQEHEYDCFVLKGPVAIEVKNATEADFAYAAPVNATFKNGVLTIS